MVAEFELIEERKISGKGLLRVPPDEDKNRSYILYASVVRQPKNAYKNFNYNPPKSRYGILTFMRKEYVLSNASIDYEQQAYDGVNDIAGQTLLALKCANNAILQSIFNLSVALAATPGGQGLQPVNFNNVIKEYTNLRLAWDECRLMCYADTAINLRLYRLKYDVCNEEFDDDNPPPPPPPPPPPTPPGEPILDISPPYSPEDNDNNDSIPYPGDNPPPPEEPTPSPGTASTLTLTYSYNLDIVPPTTVTQSFEVQWPYYVATDFQTITVYTPNAPFAVWDGVSYAPIGVFAAYVSAPPRVFRLDSATDSTGGSVDVRDTPD